MVTDVNHVAMVTDVNHVAMVTDANHVAMVTDVNIIVAMVTDVPKLPPIPGLEEAAQREAEREPDEEESDDKDPSKSADRKRRLSGPPVTDPYATDDTSSMMFPVLVAVGCFIPLVFCLCKL